MSERPSPPTGTPPGRRQVKDTVYEIQDLTKAYNARRVVDVTHLDIYRGEVLALVGPSGAGKSTLLRLLNFLKAPTSGRIRFLDADVGSGRTVPLALRRRVTTVFQRPFLLNRSVEANVHYGLRLRGKSGGARQVQAALAEVGMADLARRKARTLSGGEMQRVSLARSMVLEPDVLLLDEPTANLDPYNVDLMEGIIHTLNQDRGTTLVLITHNVFQARRLADRVGLLLDGRLIEVDETARFFEDPQDGRTAAFVRGEMVY